MKNVTFICVSIFFAAAAQANQVVTFTGDSTTVELSDYRRNVTLKASATCPSGTLVIGGGCEGSRLSSFFKIDNFGIDQSRNSYFCEAKDMSGSVSIGELRAQVSCISER